MDSINREQPEDTRANLVGRNAVERIEHTVEKAQTCFFCTHAVVGEARGVRPMAVRDVDGAGNLWFLSADDSLKNHELEIDPRVDLYFQGSRHSDFLHLTGSATVSRDKAKIKELWSPLIKTWFTEGIDDPRITVIKVTPTEGYYWDNKHGDAVAGVKMLIGAAIGKTLDDSIEGQVTPRG
jgi:general stress protein 26